MKYLTQILLYIIIIALLCFLFSLVPLKFIPEKIISTAQIKPLSMSEYGYINLFSRQYFVNNFSYILKQGNDSYIMLRADKIGISMLGNKNIILNKCEINLITSKKQSDILDIIASEIMESKEDMNIIGNDCIIEIKKVEQVLIDNIAKNENPTEDDISQITGDLSLHLENVEFDIYKNILTKDYNISSKLNDNDANLKLHQDENKTEVLANFAGTAVKYTKLKDSQNLTLQSKDIQNFTQNIFCNSEYCRRIVNSLPKKDTNIDITINNINPENVVINGKIQGIFDSEITNQSNVITLNPKNISLKDEEDSNNIKLKQISLYNLFSKYLDLKYDLNITLEALKFNDFEVEKINIQYKDNDEKLDIVGNLTKEIAITTKNNDINNFSIMLSNVDPKYFINILYPELINHEILTEDGKKIIGSLEMQFKIADENQYLASVKYIFDEKKGVTFISDSCINNCNQEITFNGLDIFDIINRSKFISILGIDKFCTQSGNIKQSALIYTSSDNIMSKNIVQTLNVTLQNTIINDNLIKNGSIIYTHGDKNKNLAFKNFESDIFSGDIKANIIFVPNAASIVEIDGKINKIRLESIAKILYPDTSLKELIIVPPSLTGFDGKIALEINDISDNYKYLNIFGNITNGIFSFLNAKMKFNNAEIKMNGNISFASKIIASIGLAVDSLEVDKILKDTIGGILSTSGTLNFSGFSGQEFLDSLSGNFTGKIYHYKLNSCNLQKLSDVLVNVKLAKSADIEQVIKSGSVSFESTNVNLLVHKDTVIAKFVDAKNKGVSSSGACSISFVDEKISNCSAIFMVIAKDLSQNGSFMPLQISWGGGGTLQNPVYKYNLEQIQKYQKIVRNDK